MSGDRVGGALGVHRIISSNANLHLLLVTHWKVSVAERTPTLLLERCMFVAFLPYLVPWAKSEPPP